MSRDGQLEGDTGIPNRTFSALQEKSYKTYLTSNRTKRTFSPYRGTKKLSADLPHGTEARRTEMPRYVIEGEWSGYNSSQQRIVHREVVTGKLAEQAKKLRTIVYTDGTALYVRVRELKRRERVEENHSYRELIRDALRHGGSCVWVAELNKPATAAEAINAIREDLAEIFAA